MGVRKRITPLIGLVNSIDKVYHYILQLLLQERPTCDLQWQLTGGLRPVAVKRWPIEPPGCYIKYLQCWLNYTTSSKVPTKLQHCWLSHA
jgi:hypothetical protein